MRCTALAAQVVLLAAQVVLLASCAGPPRGSLVFVRDAVTGTPIAGAQLSADGRILARSDSNGRLPATVSGQLWAPGYRSTPITAGQSEAFLDPDWIDGFHGGAKSDRYDKASRPEPCPRCPR